ncbi:MAG: hypothetical protein ABIH41_02960 [Nanoarchaeota archaeon]
MDMSNRTLSALLVAAIVLTLGASIISLQQLGNVLGPTGFATSSTGMVNLTILSQTDITLTGDNIDFGSGVVNSSSACNNATLHSNGSGVNTDACWVNQSLTPNSAIPATEAKFILNNSGNVNISITMDSVKNNATNFMGNSTVIRRALPVHGQPQRKRTALPDHARDGMEQLLRERDHGRVRRTLLGRR